MHGYLEPPSVHQTGGSGVLHFDFSVAGLHTCTASLTSAERNSCSVFLWLKPAHVDVHTHWPVAEARQLHSMTPKDQGRAGFAFARLLKVPRGDCPDFGN